jgi:GMP synthase PP-ATPase subunit
VQDEAKKVVSRLKDDLGINLRVVDASDRFLERLDGACNTVDVTPHRTAR